MDSITSLFIVYRYNSTNWNIHSALWWRRILLLLCLLFTDMTAQPEHSQCPLVEMDSTTSLFIVYRYDSTMGTFTVPLWWRWILLLLCLLFTDKTAQLEHSQCPLVEMDSTTSLFTDMTAQPEHSQCRLVEMDSTTSLFIVYRYDSTNGIFTVPPGGD